MDVASSNQVQLQELIYFYLCQRIISNEEILNFGPYFTADGTQRNILQTVVHHLFIGINLEQ